MTEKYRSQRTFKEMLGVRSRYAAWTTKIRAKKALKAALPIIDSFLDGAARMNPYYNQYRSRQLPLEE